MPQQCLKFDVMTRDQAKAAIDAAFAGYHGNEEAKEHIEDYLGLALTEEFWPGTGETPRVIRGGLLLVGPPSTGKTTLARRVGGVLETPYLECDGTVKSPDRLMEKVVALLADYDIP